VKGYLVKQLPGGLVFECVQCDYKIALAKEFPDVTRPRARTLAANWMNGHIARTHPISDPKLNDYGIK
jgi:hypothetical protein